MTSASTFLRNGIRVITALGLLYLPASSALADHHEIDGAQCERTISARVAVIDTPIHLNRHGAVIPGGMIYALLGDLVDEQNLQCTDESSNCEPGQVWLRSDKRPRPIVLRMNVEDCIEIEFTNFLTPDPLCFGPSASGESGVADDPVPCDEDPQLIQPSTRAASLHVQGLNWVSGPEDDGSDVGQNPDSIVEPGDTAIYALYAGDQGTFFLYDNGDGWTPLLGTTEAAFGGGDGGHITEGLFGAVNVQPPGAEYYRSQVTEQDLCLASADCAKAPDGSSCAVPCRRTGDGWPVIDYQATYPPGYEDPLSGVDLGGQPILAMLWDDALVASDLYAVISGPEAGRFDPATAGDTGIPEDPTFRPVYATPDRVEPYREFTVIYHESFQVAQAFRYYYENIPTVVSASDAFGINYSMEGLSTPILANRLGVGPLKECVDCKYEEFFLSSWTAGDPGMPVDHPVANRINANTGEKQPAPKATKALYPDDPSNVFHAYMSDHVKFRIMHAGPDLHHLHHQHAHQWLATPDSPNGDYLDSQSVGPGSAFTLEMVYNGSGNVNQTVGDSIFHCHFYPHFASGMWALWRVHDVFEAGTELDASGAAARNARALPDSEIVTGTPIPALVPLPTLPMAPLPSAVRLTDNGQLFEVCTDGSYDDCVANLAKGPAPYELKNPGYPFFIPGIAGSRAPHPPLDFAWACRDSGAICVPCDQEYCPPHDYDRISPQGSCPAGDLCEPMDGGLPRNVFYGNDLAWQKTHVEPQTFSLLSGVQDFLPLTDPQNAVYASFANADYSKVIKKAVAQLLPEGGTAIEKVAMHANAERFHPSQLPDEPFILNGLPPVPGAPFADPCINFRRQGGRAQGLPGEVYPQGLTDRYLAADLQIDAIFNKEGWHFPQQRILTLWGDVFDTLDGSRAPEPLFFRVNSYDCMEYVLANLVPNVYELDDFQVRTPTDIIGQHIHLVKFDVTSSDGAANGWNYEDGTYGPNEVTERIAALNAAHNDCVDRDRAWAEQQAAEKGKKKKKSKKGEKAAEDYKPCSGGLLGFDHKPLGDLAAKHIKFFGPGPVPGDTSWLGSQATVQRWYDDPLLDNFGLCVDDDGIAGGQGHLCTTSDTSRCPSPDNQCNASAGICSNAAELVYGAALEACKKGDLVNCPAVCTSGPTWDAPGSGDTRLCKDEKALCIPAHDRTIRTVFTHDHLSPSTHQQTGLYAGLVVEPKGSVWLNNQTGEIMGGYDATTGLNFPGRLAEGHDGTKVLDGGPTSWEAIIQGASIQNDWQTTDGWTGGPATYREFMLEFQDSTLMYEPFNQRVLRSEVKVCTTDPAWVCENDSQCPVEDGERGKCRVASICRDDASRFCTEDQDCHKLDSYGKMVPTGPCDEVGVCSNTGICSNRPLGPPCLFPPPGASAEVQATLDQQFCGPDGGTCRLVIDGGLRSCTTTGFDNCASQRVFQEGDYLTQPYAGFESCDFIPGAPNSSWSAGSPIDRSNSIEVITFRNATQNFSVNYRNEPMEARYAAASGAEQDIALIYSSAVDRPGLPADPGGFNSALCPVYNQDFAPCRFCSDNGAWCSPTDLGQCGDAKTAYCSPYAPLTPGVERGDPFTPLLRAYPGDDVQIRTLVGAHINPHNFTLHGMNWLMEPSFVDSGWRNSQVMGISEHFEMLLQVPPAPAAGNGEYGETAKPWSDYLYQPGAAAIEQSSGSWGILRSYDGPQSDLPQLSNNEAPFPSAGVCPGPPNRKYTVIALTADQALGGPPGEGLGYNARFPNLNTNAIVFFDKNDLDCPEHEWSQCKAKDPDVQPLVLRAAAGDCIEVTLWNFIPPDTCKTHPDFCQGVAFTPQGSTGTSSQTSLQVGLRPQLVTYDVRSSDGANVGFNPVQTVGPEADQPAVYTWYAGHYDPDDGRHVPIEFGAANLLPPDPLNHYRQSLFGGLIIEPPGAPPGEDYGGEIDCYNPQSEKKDKWEKRSCPDCGWSANSGTEAVVTYVDRATCEQTTFHEFVVFQQDDLEVHNALKKPGLRSTDTINAVNYKSEYLRNGVQRFCTIDECEQNLIDTTFNIPLDVSCMLSQKAFCRVDNTDTCELCTTLFTQQGEALDPPQPEVFRFPQTPVFQACAGEEVRFRLLHPGGTNTNEVFDLAGHSFSEAPYMTTGEACFPHTQSANLAASQSIGTDNLCGYTEWLRRPALDLPGATETLNDWKGSRMGQGPTNHFDAVIASAGGAFAVPGDYLYRSYPVDHFNLGMWGIFRVLDCGETAE